MLIKDGVCARPGVYAARLMFSVVTLLPAQLGVCLEGLLHRLLLFQGWNYRNRA